MPVIEEQVSKHIQLREILRERIIREHKYGDKFESELQLMNKYNLSNTTVQKAINTLAQEGLLERIRGKGTFIKSSTPKLNMNHQVGVFMPVHGHLFGDLGRFLIQGIQKHGYYSLIMDTSGGDVLKTEELVKRLNQVIEAEPSAIIIDGEETFPFVCLKDKEDKIKNLIFIYSFEMDDKYPLQADFVLSDYCYGGYLAIKHLIEKGHRRIMLFTYYHPWAKDGIPQNMVHRELMKGCQTALQEGGLKFGEDFRVVFDIPEKNEKRLIELFSSPDRPTACFAFGDSRAKEIYRVAKNIHLRIPEDLAVIGYHNTPWCEEYSPHLTSVSVREKEMAKIVVDIVAEIDKKHGRKKEKIFLKPRLVIRESTGG